MSERRFTINRDLVISLCSAAIVLVLVGIGLGYKFRAQILELRRATVTLINDQFYHPLTSEWRHEGDFGLEILASHGAEGHLLVSGFFMDNEEVGVRLIDLESGNTVKAWNPDPYEIRERSDSPRQTPDRFEPQSPLLTDDGGLIFIDNQGPLVRIDACSRIVWIAEGRQHHSLEFDLDGNLIVPSVDPPLEWPYQELRNDSVARFSLDGQKIESLSIAQILLDNGLGAVLTISYPSLNPDDYDDGLIDAVHLNDVEVARQSGPFWQVGDWVLSLRTLNMIMIYRPSTKKVVWYSIGPWHKQHDPDFNPDGSISVLGNDTIDFRGKRLISGHSDVYIVDSEKIVHTPFTESMAAASVGTPTQGVLDMLPDGDAFIEETDYGRLVRIGVNGLIWRFNNTNGERSGVLNWSRYFPTGSLPNGALQPCDEA